MAAPEPPSAAGTTSCPESLDRLHRRLVATVAADERLDDRDVPVRADRDLGIPEGGVRRERQPRSCSTPALDRRGVRVAVDDDLDRVDRADAELALEGEEAVLRRIAVGDRPDARRAGAQVERREGEREENADGNDQADDRRALDAGHDRAPEAALRGGAAAEERQPKRVDAVAEDRQHRGQERRRRRDRGDPDEHGSGGEAAHDRVGNEQHPREGDHEGRAAEEHRSARRPSRRLDRRLLGATRAALLAEARDDEERVVDPEREPHRGQHVDDEERELPGLAHERDERQRDRDRDDREQERDERGDDGAEHEQEDEQRRGQAEEELAFLQILVRDREEVLVGRELAGDRRLERAGIHPLDRLDHALDPLLGVEAHPDREHRRVLVGRDERRIARRRRTSGSTASRP